MKRSLHFLKNNKTTGNAAYQLHREREKQMLIWFDTFRNFQWTNDEKYCARMVTGEIQFWESKNAGKSVWARLKLEGVAKFSLSPGKAPAVAVFIPERKVLLKPVICFAVFACVVTEKIM